MFIPHLTKKGHFCPLIHINELITYISRLAFLLRRKVSLVSDQQGQEKENKPFCNVTVNRKNNSYEIRPQFEQ